MSQAPFGACECKCMYNEEITDVYLAYSVYKNNKTRTSTI